MLASVSRQGCLSDSLKGPDHGRKDRERGCHVRTEAATVHVDTAWVPQEIHRNNMGGGCCELWCSFQDEVVMA